MRRNRSNHDRLDGGDHHRTASREAVRRRTRWRANHNPIRRVGPNAFPIDENVEPDHAGKSALVQDEIIQSPPLLAGLAVSVDGARGEGHPRLSDVISTRQILERRLEILALTAGEKSEPAKVDAENWNVASIEKAGAAQECAVSAQCYQRVQLPWILEARTLPCHLVQSLLQQRLDVEFGRDAKERAEYFRKLFVSLMTDDTKPHQTARR